MEERPSDGTPKNILNWLAAPYKFFGEEFGNKNSTLLDSACGERIQNKFMPGFTKIFGLDMIDRPNDTNYKKHDLSTRLPFADNSFDYVFSFETIEHLPKENHEAFVKELLRVCRKTLIIGTVSADGPHDVGGDIIFKAVLNTNPFHLYEYTSKEFEEFFDKFNPTRYYISVYTEEENDVIVIPNLHTDMGISNFARIDK